MCCRRNNNEEFSFIVRISECRCNKCRCNKCRCDKCRRRCGCNSRRNREDFFEGDFFSGEEREREMERQRERNREMEREREDSERSRRCVIRNNRFR